MRTKILTLGLVFILLIFFSNCDKKAPTSPTTTTTTTTTTSTTTTTTTTTTTSTTTTTTTVPTTTTSTTTTTTTILEANCIMTEGPTWKESDWTFAYFGIVKNIGNKKAERVIVYIYLYNSANELIDYDWMWVDKYDLNPDEFSPWEISWWDDDNAIRNKLDKSKTKFEIDWN